MAGPSGLRATCVDISGMLLGSVDDSGSKNLSKSRDSDSDVDYAGRKLELN